MARNRQCYSARPDSCAGFVPWQGGGCAHACGQTAGCGCTACGQMAGYTACGGQMCTYWQEDGCPFLGGCPYPMTFDEMQRLLCGLRHGHLALNVEGVVYVTPVCFSMRRNDDTPIFTLRLRTDGNVMTHLTDGMAVTLQFDRYQNGGLCTVQAMGIAHITGSTGCVAIVEVQTESMMGECFRGGCGCQNECGCQTDGTYQTGCGCGCQNGYQTGCGCQNGCGYQNATGCQTGCGCN